MTNQEMAASHAPGSDRALPQGKRGQSRSARERAWKIVVYVLLIAGSYVFTIPLIWMISTSLRPEWDVYSYPPKIWPNYFIWQNYPDAWTLPAPLWQVPQEHRHHRLWQRARQCALVDPGGLCLCPVAWPRS